ncbi:MAG: quinolinate synthase NadA [Clostridiales bacterium]|nr:quinolinate synthase NadA [Clostridiales bacterium]
MNSAIKAKIIEEKKRSDTLILAHTYQVPDIIDIADVTGDSFFLSKKAAELRARRVIMCGVRFMGETVKILSPSTEVVMPAPEATCPMAEQISPQRVADFRRENPDIAVVAYINTTAALKAECDVCVTSSSALSIVSKLPQKDILFIPDKNLGAFIASRLPEKNIILWDGYCPVHNSLTGADAAKIKAEHPGVPLAVHPECPPDVLEYADMTGSTSEIIKYALAREGQVIIGTERGVADFLNREYPGRFIQLAPEKLVCRDMKMTTLENVYGALRGECGEVLEIDETLRVRAKKSIDNMLALG